MLRHRSLAPLAARELDDLTDPAPRRIRRDSALLIGLAVLCAAVTVMFGIWMAGVVPSTSFGAPGVTP